MRSPAFTVDRKRFWRGHLPQSIREPKAVAYAEVVHRQDIAASELKDQQHLDGPAADPTHLREPLDDGEIFQCNECVAIRHDACERFRREILERSTLREGETNRTQRRIRSIDHMLRRRKRATADGVDETLQYVGRRCGMQLLMRNGVRQRVKRRAVERSRDFEWDAMSADDPAHHSIRVRQVRDDSFAHCWQLGQ
jgi:hypothetical protein